ncbi:hypothetical protein D3C74_423320 [compost metagenome]
MTRSRPQRSLVHSPERLLRRVGEPCPAILYSTDSYAGDKLEIAAYTVGQPDTKLIKPVFQLFLQLCFRMDNQ